MSSIKSKSRFPVVQTVFGALFVASLVFGGYYFKEYKDLKADSSKTTEQLNQDYISRAGKVYELPKDETPTVVVVAKDPKEFETEQEKMFSNTFKSLRKGDIIFLYQEAGKAIQYRDSENKVIDTATFSVEKGSTVHIIASADLQNSTEQKLLSALADKIRVAGKSTPVGQYTATTVIDLTGKNTELAKAVADAAGGTVVASLPVGEKANEGMEIVVIVGVPNTESINPEIQ